MFSLLLLAGIILWPELALCVLLFASGHPFLGIAAFFATFFSGSNLVVARLRSKFWNMVFGKKEEELPELPN